jgi:hypothetical protein
MKITPKIFSVPPHISTRWENIVSLRVADDLLIVTLRDGTTCTIPHLPQETLDQIFAYHAEAADSTSQQKDDLHALVESMRTGFKQLLNMLSKLGSGIPGSIGKALEHDPANANLPEIPPDMVQKIELLLKIIPEEEIMAMPDDVEGCHCMYCQMHRILRRALKAKGEGGPDILSEGETEAVEAKDLEFSEWTVEPLADKLYKVTNKIDTSEEYRVFLGDPIGCTCGKPHCEHVLAVLRS